MANTTPGSNTKELITVEIDTDIKKALRQASRYNTYVTNNFKQTQKAVQKTEKGMVRFNKQLKASEDLSKGIKEIGDNVKALDKIIKERGDFLEHARKAANKTGKKGSPEREAAMRQYREQRKNMNVGDVMRTRRVSKKQLGQLERVKGHDPKSLKASRKEAKKADVDAAKQRRTEVENYGDELAEPLRDVFSKDATAMMRRMSKMLLPLKSDKLIAKGKSITAGGVAKLKDKKGMAKVGGGLQAGFGKIVELLGKIGPLLSMATGFMMGFVKILLDMEAAVKEYNKAILATSGTSSYLNRNFGGVAAATDDLDRSLRTARDGAMALSNVKWGITAEAARSFQAAVLAEGVALDRLGKATTSATVTSAQHTKTIQVGVAYARAFGVSLSEIAQLQGELMSNLGMGAETVQGSFQMVVDGAHEAGMETNKFFQVIRSFSSDLTLFTLRMAELTKVSGLLGKSMDPRKMTQAVQSLSKLFEGDVMENVKWKILAGPEGDAIQKRDLDSRLALFTDNIREALGPGKEDKVQEYIALLKDPKRNQRDVAAWEAQNMEALNKDKQGGTRIQEAQKIAQQADWLASGSAISGAAAMKESSLLGTTEMLLAAVKKLPKEAGGGDFSKIEDIGLPVLHSLGVTDEKIEALKSFQHGTMVAEEELINRVAKGALQEGDTGLLERLGAGATYDAEGKTLTNKEDVVKNLKAALHKEGMEGHRTFLNALDKPTRELLDGSKKELTFQEETAKFHTSTLDQLDIVIDVLTNQIWKVLNGIWRAVLKWWGGDQAKFGLGQLAAGESKDTEMMKIFTNANGDAQKAMAELAAKIAPRAHEGLRKSIAERKDIEKRLKEGKVTDPDEKAKLEARLKALEGTKDPNILMNANMSAEDYQKKITRYGIDNGVEELTRYLGSHLAVASRGGAIEQEKAAEEPLQSVQPPPSEAEKAPVVLESSPETGPITQADADKLLSSGPVTQADADKLAAGMSTVNQGNQSVLPEAIASGPPQPDALSEPIMSAGAGLPMMSTDVGPVSSGTPAEVPIKVELTFNGDMSRYVHAQVVDGTAAFDKNRRKQ